MMLLLMTPLLLLLLPPLLLLPLRLRRLGPARRCLRLKLSPS